MSGLSQYFQRRGLCQEKSAINQEMIENVLARVRKNKTRLLGFQILTDKRKLIVLHYICTIGYRNNLIYSNGQNC